MGQAGKYLRKTSDGYSHWCPACKEMHGYRVNQPNRPNWEFDGNLERPSFKPSMKITGKQTVVDDKGEWTGEWVTGPDGKALDYCCHYFVTNGEIQYQNDCTHALNSKTVPLPELPSFMQDVVDNDKV